MSDGAVLQARLVGELFVERGLLTPEQLERALEIQAERGELIGEVLVSEFDISRVELASVLAEQWAALEQRDPSIPTDAPASGETDGGDARSPNGTAASRRRIGEIFLERGFATQDDIEAALSEQKESGKPLGEVLIERGSLSRMDLASALAEQWTSLEKLRPPAPKRVEGWQQVAPAEHAAAAALGAMRPAEEPAPDVDGQPADPGLAAELALLGERVAALESQDGGGAELADEFAGIHAGLDELRERLGQPDARLGEIEGRIGALEAGRNETDGVATREELEKVAGALAQRLDGLRAHLDESVKGTSTGLEAMLETVAELQERVVAAETGGDAAQHRPELDGVQARLDELAEAGRELDTVTARVSALEERTDESPWRDEVTALQRRLDEVAAGTVSLEAIDERLSAVARDDAPSADDLAALRTRLDEVASAAAALDALRVRIATLESAPGPSEWRDEASRLRAELDGLAPVASSVDDLSRRLVAIEERPADAAWRDDVAALRAQLEDVSREQEPLRSLGARVDAIEGAAADRPWRKDVRRLVDEVGSRLDAVAGELAKTPWSGEIESIRNELAALRAGEPGLDRRVEALESVAAATPWRDELVSLRARLDELAEAQSSVGHLQERLSAVEQREDGGAWRDEAGALRGEVERIASTTASLADVAGRLAALEDAAGDGPSTADLGALSDEVRAQLGSLSARFEEANESSRLAAEALEARVAAVARELEGQAGREHPEIAALRDRVDSLGSSIEEAGSLSERLAAVEGAVAAAASRDEVLHAADELRGRLVDLTARLGERDEGGHRAVEELQAAQAALSGRLDALAAARWAPADHGHAELDAFKEGLDRIGEVARSADSLRERLEAMERLSAATPKREEVAGLYARLDELGKTIGDERLTAVRAEIDELRQESARIDEGSEQALQALGARLEELAGVVTGLVTERASAPDAVGRSELERVERAVRELGEHAREAARTASAAETSVGEQAASEAEARRTLASDLLQRLDAVAREARDDAASVGGRVEALAADTGARIDALADVASRVAELSEAIESLSGEARSGASVEAELRASEDRLGTRLASHDEAIAVLRRRLEEVASLESVLSDRAVAAASTLGARIDEIGSQLADQRAAAADTSGGLDALAAKMAELDGRVGGMSALAVEKVELLAARADALAAALAEQAASGASAVEQLAERLGVVELQAHSTPEAVHALGTRLDDEGVRLEAAEETASKALRASSGWTDAATALGSRLIAVEEALAAAADDAVGERLAEMERRLDGEASQAEARTRATEDALRDGLATLAARLAERESAYTEAGDALRRSVAGLGRAITRADEHVTARDASDGGSRRVDAYVAFAPTGEGYRLLAVDAPAPGVGEKVVLDGHDGPLLVTRIGVSPIPLDDRPCAYLEPAAPVAAQA